MQTTHPHRLDVWPAAFALLAALALVALLAAFVQVVNAGLRAGDSRRRAVAEDADALWRCTTLVGSADRDACARHVKSARAAH